MNHPSGIAISKCIYQIDQVLTAPRITEQETIEGCQTAVQSQVSTVWVKPCYVRQTINVFHNTSLNIGTFIGYPYGINTTYVKLAETKRALSEGAIMAGLSLNVGDIVGENYTAIIEEIKCISGLARMNGAGCLVLIDLSLLDVPQVLHIAEAAVKGGADGAILRVENEIDPKTEQFTELVDNLRGNNLSTTLHIAGQMSIEKLEVVLEAGFGRIGMPISQKL